MTRTYFKDRRTGAVYVTTEKTFPVSGTVPLKAAYREDTVWISKEHLDKIGDPHELSGGKLTALFALMIVIGVLGYFQGSDLANTHGVDVLQASVIAFFNSAVLFGLVARLFGLIHL